MKRASLEGRKFGKLLVLHRLGSNSYGATLWECRCDCNAALPITTSDLTRTLYPMRSCGCSAKRRVPPSKWIWFNYRGSAKRKGLSFELSLEGLATLIARPCSYCGRPPFQPMSPSQMRKHPSYSAFRYTGIDRLDSFRGYTADNCVPCCKSCNEMKSDKSREEFLRLVEVIYRWQNRQRVASA